MKYHIEHHARCYGIIFRDDFEEWDCPYPFTSFDAAFAEAQEMIDDRQQALTAVIYDGDTGEVYATCWWDDDSVPEEDYFPDDVDESNYDPYAGCDVYECEPMDYDW